MIIYITYTLLFIILLNIQYILPNKTSISGGILYWIPYDNEGLLSIYVQTKILLKYSFYYEMQLNIVPYHSRFFNETINLCNIFDFNVIEHSNNRNNDNNRNMNDNITCKILPMYARYHCKDTLPAKIYLCKL